MDLSQLSSIAATLMATLSPYLIRTGEALAQEVGKEVFTQTKRLYQVLVAKFEQTGDTQSADVLNNLDTASDLAVGKLSAQIESYAKNDLEFSRELTQKVGDLQMLLFECLQEKFLVQDLRQVYFRLDIGWDDLIGQLAGRSEKAMALIEHIKVRERIPDLIKAMWAVNPKLHC